MRNTDRNRPKKTTRQAKVPTRTRKSLKFGDDTDRLYFALQEYVKNRGGNLVVVGGIEVQEWPNDPKLCFRIAIRCTGKKPDFATQNGK